MTTKGQRFRARMAEKGFVQGNEWVPSNQRDLFRAIAKALRDGQPVTIGDRPAESPTASVPKNLTPEPPSAASTLDLSAFAKPYKQVPRIRAEQEGAITAYGVQIWPTDSHGYTFDEAWAAYQFWKDIDRSLVTANGFENPQARGRHFMSTCDYLNRASKGFVSAWRKIATAQYHNPSEAENCCCPRQHINAA